MSDYDSAAERAALACAVVAELVVRSGLRRRGVGSALLQAAERYAREAGASELRIGVLADNDAAQRLYASQGFRPYLSTLTKPLDSAT
jgi:ribosomal protein S18 acetylase RimI-like enzyme